MTDTFRPADTRCGHPATITPEQAAPDHKLGYYLSTYCEHGNGEGRDEPNLCRATCKTCHAPCACMCHGTAGPVSDGYSVAEEDRLRAAAKRVAREMGVPAGARGDELIASIITGIFYYAELELPHD